MRPFPGFAALAVVFLLSSQAARAQCASVTFKSYGTTCSFFNQQARLSARYDASGCVLTLSVGKSSTCCNTFLSGQALFLGTAKIDPGVRHPLLVTGCLLSVVPHLVFVLPRSAGGTLRLPIPRLAGKISLYGQGLNDYLTTIGRRHDYQTTQGLQIDIK